MIAHDAAAPFPATAMPDPDWWEALWPQPENVIATVGITPTKRVIDLCCGDGWLTLPIARVAHHVIAIDLDRQMLDLTASLLDSVPQSDWGQYMPWFGMFMGPVMMVLFIVIAFLVIVPLMRAMGMGPPSWHGHSFDRADS